MIFSLADLVAAWSRLLRCTPRDIEVLLMRGPYQYKHYQIDKRSGGKRDIFHPAPNLKAIQRWLVSESFSLLPIHDSVFSYRTGLGIRDHAQLHLHSNYLLRLDFVDFFPSIDAGWLRQFLMNSSREGVLNLDESAVLSIIRVVCRFSKADQSLALSIGAPSSPMLSNAILFDVDKEISARCDTLGCLYSRYADDIYVSAREKNVLVEAERQIHTVLSVHAPKLRFNDSKKIDVSKKTRRVVTGLVLTPERNISVGRELKRSIKTQIYLYTAGALPDVSIPHLCGLVSYVKDVEPRFYESLRQKFGSELMERLYRNKLSDKTIQ